MTAIEGLQVAPVAGGLPLLGAADAVEANAAATAVARTRDVFFIDAPSEGVGVRVHPLDPRASLCSRAASRALRALYGRDCSSHGRPALRGRVGARHGWRALSRRRPALRRSPVGAPPR